MEDNFQKELQDLKQLADGGESLDESQQSRLAILNKLDEAEKTAMQKSKDLESALAQKEHYRTKFEEVEGKAKDKKPNAEPKLTEKTGLDLVEETYLISKGYKENQFPKILEEIKRTGKNIKEVLGYKYFQEELAMDASKEALPTNTKRLGGNATSDVEYWLNKLSTGQATLSSIENIELRRKVAKARASIGENSKKFTDKPIV